MFTNQVVSSKILGAMVTKMATTWRVALFKPRIIRSVINEKNFILMRQTKRLESLEPGSLNSQKFMFVCWI